MIAKNAHVTDYWRKRAGLPRAAVRHIGGPHAVRGLRADVRDFIKLEGYERRRDLRDIDHCLAPLGFRLAEVPLVWMP